MTTPAPAVAWPFDARPLVEPVDRAAARAYVRDLRARGSLTSTTPATVVGIVVFVLAIVVIVPVVLVTAVTTVLSVFGDAASPITLLPLVALAVAFTAVGVAVYRQFRGGAVTIYRLARFAAANGMDFVPRIDDPALPGMIFTQGRSRIATDLVRGTQPRFVEFGNFRYTIGSGKNQSTKRWGYVAVRLDVPLPNIVLDATANDALFGSNLPANLDRAQRLSLEGDFDRSFALYCPEGYERDALYLFTPDIMARFIDNAAVLDVEIVDDWLFLYSPRPLSTTDPATWAWLFATIRALLDKLAQWGRWRDDRLAGSMSGAPGASASPASPASPVADAAATPFAAPVGLLRPPPGVAAPGRRLKRAFPWLGVIIAVVFVLGWFVLQSGFFGLLGLVGR